MARLVKNRPAERLASLFHTLTGTDLPVRIRAWDGSEAGPVEGPVVVLRSRRALRRLLWAPGELGLARAYVCGDLEVDGDLAEGFRRAWAAARPRSSLTTGDKARMAAAAARLGVIGPPPKTPEPEARLSGRAHTRRRDRAAIAHHYDLSNDFYRLLLDDHMAYSCAYFTDDARSLHDAQTAKLDLICRKLDLKPGMSLLDVGCGWGSLILYAAHYYGVTATGITLSAQQHDFVAAQVADRALTDRVCVHQLDYRELPSLPRTRAGFDAAASIEMGEHVGENHYPEYTASLYRALKPTGRLLLQQMSRRADSAPGGGPFIEAYIAPDMHMRPLPQTLGYLATAGFEIRDVEAMREHYVKTVDRWISTFEDHYDEFVALQGEQAARVWRLYLVGGRLAFDADRMGVDQILAVKTTPDGFAAMPFTRPWARAQ
jgi:cyclopropane-fatty-acyl-phospholipid synthase